MSPTEPDGATGRGWAVRGLVGLALAGAFVAWLASGLYTVRAGDGEVGVALRFGRVVAERVPGGVHWNLPRPLGSVDRVKTAEPYAMSVGFRFVDDQLGKPPTPAEVQWLTGDTNIVDLQAIFQWVIDDPVAYLHGTSEPAKFVVKRAAETAMTEVVGRMDVETVLTSGQRDVLTRVVARTNELLARYRVGVVVVEASFQSVDPTQSVQYHFREVQNAAADAARVRDEAHGYANDLLPRTRGEARSIVLEARAEADARVERARGEADRFERLLCEVRRAPERTRERLYLEVLEDVLGRARLVIVDEDTDLTLFDEPGQP